MLKLFWSKLIRDKTAIVALTILSFIIIAIIFLPLVYTTPMDMIDFSQSSLPPNWQHPFGTNDLGQDQLARILFGGRVSLTVGVTSMIVAISVGTMVGAIAGYYGGVIDNILMRITDICLSLPQLPILLLVIYLFRDPVKSLLGAELGIFSLVVLIIGLLNWMSVARLVRSSFLQIKEREFISAARSLGANSLRIMWQHILPNVINIIIVAATLAVGNGIIVESTLSFLGLGFPPDIPTWGRMLYEAQEYLPTSPHMAIFPGLAIFLTVLSINYLGDKFN
ncbi:ABC transporter permease [Cyanobacterium aponinum FACHB-4101]|uniref:ABC transporter permease n=1 Tax=Cyanobacterium aponinum TaxID=379064 RepID=UPI0016807294|nr:ABC transporter permease [Cyanobacterium aponinum]MBD2393820.1 ABC transporter permease [Cyanobacterium aponinum FACHB-4101]